MQLAMLTPNSRDILEMEKLVILNTQHSGKDILRCHIQDANEIWILNEVYACSKTQVMNLNIYPTLTQENAQWEFY